MAFITQRGEMGSTETTEPPMNELSELEALVSGINQVSQSTLLLKKMKEMSEVDDSLDYMKEQYARRMAACDERQNAFEKRQAEMEDQVARFEKLISENDAKRSRAEAKAKTEKQTFKAKCKELEKLEDDLKSTEKERDMLVRNLLKLRKYQRYLEKTVDASEGAEDTWDLLNRYKTLRNANVDLMRQEEDWGAERDGIRSELQSKSAAHTNQILVQNSRIHSDQQRVERLRMDIKEKADLKEKAQEDAKGATREVGQVVLAIRNIYLRCLNSMHSKVAVLPESTEPKQQALVLEACLKLVCERVCDLHDIEHGYPAWVARRRTQEAAKAEAAALAKMEAAAAAQQTAVAPSSSSSSSSSSTGAAADIQQLSLVAGAGAAGPAGAPSPSTLK